MPHLTILNGPNHGRLCSLSSGKTFRIGRDPSLELPIDDLKASRVHVEIDFKDGQVTLKDLRSKNGTLVNGDRITTVTLKEGDQIQIGETRLQFSALEAPKDHVQRFDSIMAARLPVGAVPALGNAGEEGSTEGFETLELDGTLPLLRLEGKQDPASTEPPPTASIGRDTPARLERANVSLRALYSIARACAESKTTKQLLTILAARLRAALEADRVTPILLDDTGHWHVADLTPEQTAGNAPQAEKKAPAFSRVPVSRTIVDYALRTRRSVLTAPRTDARFGGALSIGEQGITSAMCVPIAAGEKILGLIYADRLGGQDFDREDQELLTGSCLQAAPAMSNLLRLEEAITRKERLLSQIKSQHKLLGESDGIKAMYGFIERAAPTDSLVLVLGESGTGKELVATAIHFGSNRSEGPLVIVNCAALSESLIESELFGHAKGAFTGATADRKGRFELAHEGTIFLDEIGELSAACQTKLLRVIEQSEISRVGESRVRKVNVRLVAATNRELAAEAKAGRFREDLFYRLNVLTIKLSPLRERGADIRLLLEHFLLEAAGRCGRPSLRFSDEANETLVKYPWPGNIRELRNLTERLAVLCPGEIIGVRDLPAEVQAALAHLPAAPAYVEKDTEVATQTAHAPGDGATLKPLSDIEKDHILRVLAFSGGNKKQAAELLGIDRSTLYAKLRAYGILAN
ncbi:MAG: sigma 54-interacting transcriptional regulator [Planctomycetes bacterium]|nr:sigma 54-interacting transcriptional regulator [Planctomycetota bacterium]